MIRQDGRAPDALRVCTITPDFVSQASGSCLIEMGGTRVIVTASAEMGVPPFLRGTGKGWLTAEYAMLPASTGRRKPRDGVKKDSRGVEISRLIGRSLRQAVDLGRLGEMTLTIDCDVLEADGGTRTAAVTGGFVALCLAVDRLIRDGKIKESPITHQLAAVSCGLVSGQTLLDLCYQEDSKADADVNIVMNDQFDLIEIQGTGEGASFPVSALNQLILMAKDGISRLMELQRQALGEKAYVIGQKQTLVLATGNSHKIQELKQLLGDHYRVIGMREAGFVNEVEETGKTFAQNATLKAEAVRDATGLLTLADDSGLEVDALDNAPGVLSARYAGQHGDDKANNDLLLQNLKNQTNRGARFVCCLALASPHAKTRVFEGICEGAIAQAPRGEGGFGYDPLFEVEGGMTFAQIGKEQKNKISHRARAIAKLLAVLA